MKSRITESSPTKRLENQPISGMVRPSKIILFTKEEGDFAHQYTIPIDTYRQ